MIGLPPEIEACLFDLDGVLTQTAKVHAAAWKTMFDEYLRKRAQERGEEFREFDAVSDYDEYVDGKPRYEGVRSFLASRHIDLPQGSPSDAPDKDTIDGLGNRKNELVLELIHRDGVQPYEGSVRFVKAVRDAGLRRAVVSSSTNCRDVLVAAGILDLFEVIVDGVVAEHEHLAGKPAPDTFLAAARKLGVGPPTPRSSRTRSPASRQATPGASAGRGRRSRRASRRAQTARRRLVVKDLAELLEQS